MKKLTLIILLAFGINAKTMAQTRTTRYCIVLVQTKGFSSKLIVTLKEWKHPELFSFSDTTVITKLNAVTTMETEPDILNYMTSLNWTLVKLTHKNYDEFVFKREFDPSELKQ